MVCHRFVRVTRNSAEASASLANGSAFCRDTLGQNREFVAVMRCSSWVCMEN
ncbi:hypothetical protein RRSWK_05374 [Rhodopirellula sp. SWK7]|nr:hypothetical protein RRSWK_05374 [Rhodopirellula sp. SWK7]